MKQPNEMDDDELLEWGRRVSLDELGELAATDPLTHRRYRRAFERQHKEGVRLNLEDEKSLVAELETAGIPASRGAWMYAPEHHPASIPILIRHLRDVPHRAAIKHGIARALQVPAAAELASPALIAEYLEAEDDPILPGGDYKWMLSTVLQEIAPPSVTRDLIAIVHDRRHHVFQRRNFVWALGRNWRSADALAAVRDLLNDDELGETASKVLRRYRKA
jgi:hypothetical protein